jgi:hypothetical protein
VTRAKFFGRPLPTKVQKVACQLRAAHSGKFSRIKHIKNERQLPKKIAFSGDLRGFLALVGPKVPDF